MRPRILITLDEGEEPRRGVPFSVVKTKRAYVESVERAGGLPLLVAPTADAEVIADLVRGMDGLVVTGGAFDIPPEMYGATRGSARIDAPKPGRTRFEWDLMRAALDRGRPLLGVCGGMQLLNVVLGGTLILDIRTSIDGALDHEQASSPADPDHDIQIAAGLLADLAGSARAAVNSTHHQAVLDLGAGLTVLARAPDGVIEAIGLSERPEVLGVQWHPELLDDALSRALYRHVVVAAARVT